MRCFYRERKWICGDYMEVELYPVWQTSPKRRRARCKPTSEIQQKLNEKNAREKLTRLVHCNFFRGYYSAGLDYDVSPESEEQALCDIQKFFRKARKLYKAADREMKYIWVMERRPRSGDIHFHIFISGGVDRTALEALWGHGYYNTKALRFKETGVTGLCIYSIKDDLRGRRWNSSHNLVKPQPQVNNYRITQKNVKRLQENSDVRAEFEGLYSGYTFVDCERAFVNKINRGVYVTARFYRSAARVLGEKEKTGGN